MGWVLAGTGLFRFGVRSSGAACVFIATWLCFIGECTAWSSGVGAEWVG